MLSTVSSIRADLALASYEEARIVIMTSKADGVIFAAFANGKFPSVSKST